MIVTKLMGGLGNQLFQYAAGKALASHIKTICKVDISFLDTPSGGVYTQRKFELNAFETVIEVMNEKEVQQFIANNKSKLNKLLPALVKSKIVTETGHQFQPNFFNSPDNSFLNGFWQSEKYFKSFEKEIRKDLVFKTSVLSDIESWINLIKQSNSVSLHIRRGDYVNLDSAKAFHGICSMNYYKEALDIIRNSIGDITVFVFSDDIEWCKSNFKTTDRVYFVETDSNYKEMHLMQNCMHHIIANSSFSWWGAWLNPSEEKMVVAPKKWFADESINVSDIIPNNWIKI